MGEATQPQSKHRWGAWATGWGPRAAEPWPRGECTQQRSQNPGELSLSDCSPEATGVKGGQPGSAEAGPTRGGWAAQSPRPCPQDSPPRGEQPLRGRLSPPSAFSSCTKRTRLCGDPRATLPPGRTRGRHWVGQVPACSPQQKRPELHRRWTQGTRPGLCHRGHRGRQRQVRLQRGLPMAPRPPWCPGPFCCRRDPGPAGFPHLGAGGCARRGHVRSPEAGSPGGGFPHTLTSSHLQIHRVLHPAV